MLLMDHLLTTVRYHHVFSCERLKTVMLASILCCEVEELDELSGKITLYTLRFGSV